MEVLGSVMPAISAVRKPTGTNRVFARDLLRPSDVWSPERIYNPATAILMMGDQRPIQMIEW